MRGLYAIVDWDAATERALDPIAMVAAVAEARPAAIQLRGKNLGAKRALAWLREAKPIASRAGVPLFGNDRIDLALLAACAGVHLGQTDAPPALARHLAGERAFAIGRSTHDEAQLRAALEEPIDYVAIGPVRATTNKENPDPTLGVHETIRLARIARAERPSLPVCAIGGLDEETLRELAPHVDLCAVIGALVAGASSLDDVTRNARALVRAMSSPVNAASLEVTA